MQLVLLAGELGEKYGKHHEYYNLQTPADAIKLLCINYPSLREEMVQAHHNGVGYKVIQGGAAMGYDELQLPFGSKPLLVVPVIAGAGSGGSTAQILLGVGLVALAIANPAVGFGLGGAAGFGAGAAAGAAAGATATLGASLTALGGNLGIALILGGTANLISPQPTLANANANRIKGEGTNVRGTGPDGVSRGASGTQSYAFSGPANSVGTGATLPVIYGKVITGSHLVAIDLDITDESDPQKTAIQTPSLKTLTVNGEFLSTKGKKCGGLISRLGHTPKDFVVNSSAGMTGQQGVRFPRHKIENVFGPEQAYAEQLESGASYTTNVGGSGRSNLPYKEDSDKRKVLDVIFRVRNGLFDFVGRDDTTKIDGFITYEINVAITRGGPDVVIASARVTLQGLVEKSQNFTYGHRLELPKASNRGGDGMDVTVEIIDAAVHNDTTFEVQSYGYKILKEIKT
tara:strand:- start:1217 stop:2593 length:1377 start_codon:yes stop_codon:yes gene_type:complete